MHQSHDNWITSDAGTIPGRLFNIESLWEQGAYAWAINYPIYIYPTTPGYHLYVVDGTWFDLDPQKRNPKTNRTIEPPTTAIRPSNHSGTHLPWSPPVSSTKWIIFLRRFGNRAIWRGSGSPPGFYIYCKEPIRIWSEIGGKDTLANQIVPRHGRPLPCGGAISPRGRGDLYRYLNGWLTSPRSQSHSCPWFQMRSRLGCLVRVLALVWWRRLPE